MYDSGMPSANGWANKAGESQRLVNANELRRPSDCAARVVAIMNGAPTPNGSDAACKNAIGVRLHAAGADTIKGPQKDCACLLPNFKVENYRARGPAENGGTTSSSGGSWICAIDDGDVTKGETFLPVPKKSGKYSADGPSEEKPNLSPEEKAKCKANRDRLKAARKAMKEKKSMLKEAKAAFKDAKATFKAIKAEMENC